MQQRKMKRFKVVIVVAVLILTMVMVIIIPENRNEMKTGHFTFFFSKGIEASGIKDLSHALESAYSTVSTDLKTTPAQNIEVNIYAQRWRYIKATKNWGGSGNIEGVGKLHFVEQAWGEADSKKVAVHEFVHTVVLKLLIDREAQPLTKLFDQKFLIFPIWLWEAVSVYEAGQFVDPKTLVYLNDEHYPGIKELNDRLKGGKIYTCGYTLIEYILSTYGQDGLIKLIENYGNLSLTFNVTEEQFSKDWYAFVKQNYLQ